jgi:hypothetical protein
MSSRLRDLTETTEAEGRDDTHHGSTLGTDPCRASTKPSTSNESVCGLRSLAEQHNQKSSIDQRSRTRSQTSPAASIAIHQQRNHQLTPTRSWNIAPVFRFTACGQRKASTATSSATRRKLAAARTILIVTVSIVALSIIAMTGITQHGGAAPSVIAPRLSRTWLPASASAMHRTAQQTRSCQYRWSLSIDRCDSRTHSAWGR